MSDDASTPTWHDPVRLCLRGLRDASGRLREVEGAADELATAAAIAEAVMWCCSLDELWRGPAYDAERDADDDGRLIPGLRWARNRGIHEVLALHTTTEGLSLPMRFPMRFYTVSWRSDVADDRRGNDSYTAHLQGQQVWLTLAKVERFLFRTASAKRSIPNDEL